MRNVKQIYRANSQHWVGDGFLVQPLFSHMGDDRGTNPFLMLDYAAPYEFSPNEARSPRGVGQHPHKGFETVTIAYHGEVAHRDSSGGGGIIYEGDVQWMTAGSGIIHEEFHSENFSKQGGLFEMVQLWVNLPAKDKNTPPRYQHLAKTGIPVVELPDEAGCLRLIAGEYKGVKGAADTFTEMNVWDIVLNAGKKEQAGAGQLVGFEKSGGNVHIEAGSEEVKILLLSGVPIDEPVVGYGPFVMNTAEEIRQAISDFKSGKFGSID